MMLKILLGVVFTVLGAEAILRGSQAVRRHFNLPAFIAGLLLVGFGTSLPETAISIGATLMRFEELALGLLLGSAVVNLALILGICAVIKPLSPDRTLLSRDATATLGASIYLFASAIAQPIGWLWPVFGLLLFALYVSITLRREAALGEGGVMAQKAGYARTGPAKLAFGAGLMLIGLAAIVFGSAKLIEGSVGYAADMGISSTVIGLLVVALITSIPEAVIAFHSTYRGRGDVAVGSLLGSNIFNLLVVMPICMLLMPAGESLFASNWAPHALIASLITFIACAMILTDRRVSRLEGAALLIIYGGTVLAVLN
ncbi:MAG: sodium:calcium antiporter [Pseudomonadota bacterium]